MYSFLRMRIDVFLLHFEQLNGCRTTGREFSTSPLLKAGSERIFFAFPLAANVTRLRLKYLLVDFMTMGSCHHRRLSPFLFAAAPVRHATSFTVASIFQELENSSPSKMFYVTFLSFVKLDLHLPLNLTNFEANRSNLFNALRLFVVYYIIISHRVIHINLFFRNL